jgi:hypothetical protein
MAARPRIARSSARSRPDVRLVFALYVLVVAAGFTVYLVVGLLNL